MRRSEAIQDQMAPAELEETLAWLENRQSLRSKASVERKQDSQLETRVKVGEYVIYVDPVARQHKALVTAVHGDTCINAVYVSGDESKTDPYGRQIERQSSLSHRTVLGLAHGNYYMLPGEDPNPVRRPEET
jgi:hypothetical protein